MITETLIYDLFKITIVLFALWTAAVFVFIIAREIMIYKPLSKDLLTHAITAIRKIVASIIRIIFIVFIMMSILCAIHDFILHKPLSEDRFFIFFSTAPRMIGENIIINIITELLIHG